jgi:hypothetical protein
MDGMILRFDTLSSLMNEAPAEAADKRMQTFG